MEKVEYENSNTFNYKREGVNYLLSLGATPIEIEEVENYDNKYYLFDNILFQPYGEYKSLFAKGIPSDIETKLEHSPVSDCFYGNNVLNLEGLIYLHSLINCKDDDFDHYYEERLHEAKYNVLTRYYHEFMRVLKPDTVDHLSSTIGSKTEERFITALKTFDNFTFPTYLLDNHVKIDNFIDNTVFHCTGAYKKSKESTDEDCGVFEYKRNRIHGYLEILPNFVETTLMDYRYADPDKHDQIYHFVGENRDTLKYFKATDDYGCVQLDLINNEITDSRSGASITRQATQKDYEIFADLLEDFALSARRNLTYNPDDVDYVEKPRKM